MTKKEFSGDKRCGVVASVPKRQGELAIRRKNPIAAAANMHTLKAKRREEKEKFVRSVFYAALNGKWGTVLSMVNADNVNEPDRLGKRLIMIAAMQDEVRVMERLVYAGAFKQATDDVGRDAVFYAVKEGKERASNWLVRNEAGWERALETAVREGRILLAGRFKVFGATAEEIGALRKKYPVSTMVLSDRVRGVDDNSLAVMALERMFTDHRFPTPTGQKDGASAEKTPKQGERRHEPTTDFIC